MKVLALKADSEYATVVCQMFEADHVFFIFIVNPLFN